MSVNIDDVIALRNEGKSSSVIAEELSRKYGYHVTRNMVIGNLYRHDRSKGINFDYSKRFGVNKKRQIDQSESSSQSNGALPTDQNLSKDRGTGRKKRRRPKLDDLESDIQDLVSDDDDTRYSMLAIEDRHAQGQPQKGL